MVMVDADPSKADDIKKMMDEKENDHFCSRKYGIPIFRNSRK